MTPVYIHGAHISSSWQDASLSLTDLIFQAVVRALKDAQMTAGDIDAVVLAAHDLVDGRGLTNMVTAPSAAAYLKDETRLGDDGATAFILGDARVRSGSVRTCLVAGWGRASEGPVDEISHALFDPFTARPLAMTEVAVSGLRATRALGDHPGYAQHRERAADRRPPRPEHPGRTPGPAWPLQPAELPVWTDLVAAVVLSCAPSAVEVRGVGMSTEPYDVGDRDLLALPALRQATQGALKMADTDIADIELFELDGLTTFDQALAAEAVGAAAPGQGMQVLAEGDRVNTAADAAAEYCAPAMGLVRIVRAREQLLTRGSRTALASGSSVVASQTQAAVVLRRA
jgi:hypothetical protein